MQVMLQMLKISFWDLPWVDPDVPNPILATKRSDLNQYWPTFDQNNPQKYKNVNPRLENEPSLFYILDNVETTSTNNNGQEGTAVQTKQLRTLSYCVTLFEKWYYRD